MFPYGDIQGHEYSIYDTLSALADRWDNSVACTKNSVNTRRLFLSTADALGKVWLFTGLEKQQLDAIASFAFQKTFAPDEVIIEEGRTGNGLFVVSSGNVEVVKGLGTENAQVVAKFGPGEVFGEMALLGEWPRTASVRAIDEVECIGIDRWVFIDQLGKQPEVAIRMLQILAQRLKDTDERLAES